MSSSLASPAPPHSPYGGSASGSASTPTTINTAVSEPYHPGSSSASSPGAGPSSAPPQSQQQQQQGHGSRWKSVFRIGNKHGGVSSGGSGGYSSLMNKGKSPAMKASGEVPAQAGPSHHSVPPSPAIGADSPQMVGGTPPRQSPYAEESPTLPELKRHSPFFTDGTPQVDANGAEGGAALSATEPRSETLEPIAEVPRADSHGSTVQVNLSAPVEPAPAGVESVDAASGSVSAARVSEQARPSSAVTTDSATERSSRSSSSRLQPGAAAGRNPSSPLAPAGQSLQAPSTSSFNLSSHGGSSGATTPLRSPGLGLSGFKSRFFSSPSSSSSSAFALDQSSSSRGASGSGGGKSSKADKYRGLGRERDASPSVDTGVGTTSQQSLASSSQSSSNFALSSSPRTPARSRHGDGVPTTPGASAQSPGEHGANVKRQGSTKSRGSMARFLRRVVSAPNAKALFSPSTTNLHEPSGENVPPVPPLPSSGKSGKFRGAGAGTTPITPVSVFPANAGDDFSPSSSATSALPTASPMDDRSLNGYPFPTAGAASTASLPPHRTPNGTAPSSPLNPATATSTAPPVSAGARTARALTLGSSSGSRIKESLAHLGVGTPSHGPGSNAPTAPGSPALSADSRHKAVFRRTYSSNSIKTRSVEVSPSSFQKIKLLGKGDVGKVYLVREKKTDKLFAMKGESTATSK